MNFKLNSVLVFISMTTTTNGNPSYATIGKPYLDFFAGVTRHTDDGALDKLISDCLDLDPGLALMAFFQKRDCREGAGERKPFIHGIKVLSQDLRFQLYEKIPEYGYWDDLNSLARILPEDRDFIAKLFAEKLSQNIQGFSEGKIDTTLEKWRPTEEQQDDKSWHAVASILKSFEGSGSIRVKQPVLDRLLVLATQGAQKIDPEVKVKYNDEHDLIFQTASEAHQKTILEKFQRWNHVVQKALMLPEKFVYLSRSGYRKWCSFMRAFTEVTEHYMTEDISLIDYSHVPSISFNRNEKHFSKHDQERFSEFTAQVKSGKKKKINVGRLMPYELVVQPSDDVRDAQWKLIVDETRQFYSQVDESNLFHPKNAIHVADVSASMTRGTPSRISVAKSLTILMGEVGRQPIYTFSAKPKKIQPDWENLTQALDKLKDNNYNTDFKRLLDLIHDQPERPKSIFVYTDGGFDQMCTMEPKSASDYIQQKFSDWEMPPVIVFWNVAGNITDFATTESHKNIVQLAGSSKDLFKVFTRLTSFQDLSPDLFFRAAVLTERYEPIRVIYEAWKKSDSSSGTW